MQSISFNVRNAFLGLGSASVFLMVYLVQIILVILLKIIIMITGEKFIKKDLLNKLLKGLFFNSILSITMEGYIDFLINGFLNIYSKDTSTNGEILGFVFGVICIFLTVNFLPIALIWAIF